MERVSIVFASCRFNEKTGWLRGNVVGLGKLVLMQVSETPTFDDRHLKMVGCFVRLLTVEDI